METQCLESIDNNILKLAKHLSSRSLSGIYKSNRKRTSISMIGNYPLLNYILHFLNNHYPKHHWSKSQMLRAIHIAGFYKDEGLKHAYIPSEWKKYLMK